MTETTGSLGVGVPQRRNLAMKVLPLAAAVVFLHWHTLSVLVRRWYFEGDYTYGFFVPLVSLYLLWLMREGLFKAELRPQPTGFFIIGLALLMQFGGAVANIGYLQATSLVVLLLGAVYLLGGKGLLRATAFPILYLLIMIPLPGAVYDRIAFPLQLLASWASATVLEILRIPVDQEGNVFHLAGTTLQVAEACSGIRSLIGLLGMGILLGYLVTSRLWERVVLAVSTIPIAVAANIVRVAGTGIICQYAGVKWGQGFYHGFSAWLVFVFALAVLFIESAIISALCPERKETADNGKKGDAAKA